MDDQLIFLLIPESKWGSYIVQPVRAADKDDFYICMGSFADKKDTTPEEKQIFKLCQRLETGYLYKTYGKKKYKSERDFLLKVDEDLIKMIRSFIDKTVTELLKLIIYSNLPLYVRESRLENPYKKDRIIFHAEPLKVRLRFYRTEQDIRYRLTLINHEEELIPSKLPIRIIGLQPGIILIENELFYLPDNFSSIRLKPFLTKEEVIIPRQNEKEYFRKFILKNISNEDIDADGFEIIERAAQKKAVLSLERDITSAPTFELRFQYNQRTISSYSKNPAIVELEEDEDNYRFYKTYRDFTWEKECESFLVEKGMKQIQSGYFKLMSNNEWYSLVEWIRSNQGELEEKGFEIRQERLPVQYYTGKWELDYTQETTTDWFQLHATITLDNGEVIPLQALWQNILSGNREYHFGENSVFIIPEEWFARYGALMLFGDKQKDKVVLNRNQFSLLENEKVVLPIQQLQQTEVPGKLKATLRAYQLTGYRWLYHLYSQKMGMCLADDMGLGKTIQTIALLLKYKEETKRSDSFSSSNQKEVQLDLFSSPVEKEEEEEKEREHIFHTCLIVAPASVVHNWRNELVKFAPSLTVAEYTGASRSSLKYTLNRWDIVITTYQTLRNDIDFLKNQHFGIVVLDESQNFKNRESQVHQAVSQIAGDHFIALSGTPIENSLSDLWSLMYVINRGLLGNYTTFQNYFIRPITADITSQHSESLRKLIAPFILRRTKEEVLKDLPERTDELIVCESDPEQQKMYEEELSKARNRLLEKVLLKDKGRNEALGSLQAIMRLRQIANHPRMADQEYSGSSGKFKEIFRMLEELVNTNHKVLLFSDYVSYLNLIAEEMKVRNWEYAMLTGSTTNREEVISHFSHTENCHFFLISLKAGGVGLNLTEADYVFILDPWWNLAAEEQAISRSHRLGQKQAVFVYRFITAGTLEEKILHIQQQKQQLSDAFILSADHQFHPNESELEKLLLE